MRPVVRRAKASRRDLRRRWLETTGGNRIHSTCALAQGIELRGSTLEEWSAVAHHGRVIRCTIGAYSSIGRCSTAVDADVGRFVATSWDLTINTPGRPAFTHASNSWPWPGDGHSPPEQPRRARVHIGNDVWLGANCVILEGCTLGHGAIVGSGAVVTRDVEPYAIVIGNPARVQRFRFSADRIERLLRLAWWDLDASTLRRHLALFQRQADDATLDALEAACARARGLIVP